MILDTESYFE